MMRQSTTSFVIIGCCQTEGACASDRIFASPSCSPSKTARRRDHTGDRATRPGIVR